MSQKSIAYTIAMLFAFTSCEYFSQEIRVNPTKLSKYEKRWIVKHPCAALKVRKTSRKCYVIYNQTELDGYSNGGKQDAFRHVFFMAAFAQKVSEKKLRKLGFAHEKANHQQFLKGELENGETPDSLSSIMDLQNNELGFRLGKENRGKDLKELAMKAKLEILIGKAVIVKRSKAGVYLDCNEKALDLPRYSRVWNVPKCLAPSDYNYPE